MAFMPTTVLENVTSLTPGCRLPVAGLRMALTEMRAIMSAEASATPARSTASMTKDFFIIITIPRERYSASLLQRNQHEHQAATAFECGHGFADDRTRSFGMIDNFHPVSQRVGCGDQVARF